METTLRHNHVTFTIPGQLSRLLFKRRYAPEQMISLAAGVYKNFLKSSAQVKRKEFKPGILATLHKSENGLNMNPHIHLIGTQYRIDRKTGEIIKIDFLPYIKIRYTRAKAVEHSFEKSPEICPECSSYMIKDVVYSFAADKEIQELIKSHGIVKGYFVPFEKTRPPRCSSYSVSIGILI